jgi:predicted HD phosphohydrolase
VPSVDVAGLLAALDGVVDGTEAVDERAHALQSGALALANGEDDALITAALLHDIARAPHVAARYPELSHERAGAAFLFPAFGARVAWLVGAHVVAKLYLLETDPAYIEHLSPESRASALVQGRSTASTRAYANHPWWEDALRLRRYDDGAKDPDLGDLPERDLIRIASALAARAPASGGER